MYRQPAHTRTDASRFLTNLLHDPTYRRAHKIDAITARVREHLAAGSWTKNVAVVILHYVEDPRGKCHLAVNALIRSDANDPGSCIQGDVTEGVNVVLDMCHDLGLMFSAAVPLSFTTNLSGLHITKDGVAY